MQAMSDPLTAYGFQERCCTRGISTKDHSNFNGIKHLSLNFLLPSLLLLPFSTEKLVNVCSIVATGVSVINPYAFWC